MSSPKRISFTLALIAANTISLIVVQAVSKPETALATNTKIKVLRRNNDLKVKPTKTEIESLRTQEKDERQLEDTVPKHLPIKIKVRKEKEKAFKDLSNRNWGHDFELEVTNTGTKPIYYLLLIAKLPEIVIGEGHLAFVLRYGRPGLTDFSVKVTPDDIPLLPKESTILRLHRGDVLGWEQHRQMTRAEEPKKIKLSFQVLRFVDGTGFHSTDGAPWPPENRKNEVSNCVVAPSRNQTRSHHASKKGPKFRIGGEPTSFLSAGFSRPTKEFLTETTLAAVDSCCPTGCERFRSYDDANACYGINCETVPRAERVPCDDPRGSCQKRETGYRTCYVPETNFIHYCAYDELTPCATPSPTPTPLPTPEYGLSDTGLYTQQCVDHYWVWFVSYDGGVTWWPTGEVQYAGCFLTY